MMISSLALAGAERNVVAVAPYIQALGVDLYLISMNKRRDTELADEFEKTGIPRYDLDAKRMTDPAAVMRFTTMLRAKKIQFIHAQDQDSILYAALARSSINLASVMSRHILDEPQDNLREKMRAQMVLRSAKLGFDRVIAVSEAARQHFSTLAGIPLEQIETIYNGLDSERFQVSTPKAELRRKFGWNLDAPVVTMVAVLRRKKGHEVLLDAIPYIKTRIPNVRIKFVGSGELETEIKAWAEPYADTVEFMGQRTDVPDILAASDMLVLPSWTEALPTVLLEAGAAGLPVVATDVGGTQEIVKNGETGYIIAPGDVAALAGRITVLLENPHSAWHMGKQAREHINANFSLSAQARKTVDLYERLVAK